MDEPGSKAPHEVAGRRDAVLRLLRDSAAPVSIADVARSVGVHPNTARFHLAALVRTGQARLEPAARARPGRPAQLFRAVPGMDPTGPRHFRLLAEVLASTLAADPDARARATTAGREWGRRELDGAGRRADASHRGADEARPAGDDEGRVEADAATLVGLLGELGFAPERAAGSARIGLRRCPFLEVAQQRTDVVCGVHLGLMQGALAARDAAITVDELEAFVEPDLCVAHLTLAGATR